MKNFLFLLFTASLFLTACNSDDDNNVEPANGGFDSSLIVADLHYDSDNFAAPLLDAGTHTAAARFTSTEMTQYVGQNLDEVLFYIDEVPATCNLIIRGRGTDTTPGDVFFASDITSLVRADSWNAIGLNEPVPIDDEDLWICIEFTHNNTARTVGCDAGTANTDGDWIISTIDNGGWQTLRDFTAGQVDINWNIRGRVSP